MKLFLFYFFFFYDTSTTEIYTLSLHDALPISQEQFSSIRKRQVAADRLVGAVLRLIARRSEEHTSELQSHSDLVCRLLLEKKKEAKNYNMRSKPSITYSTTSHAKDLATTRSCT